MENAPFNNVVKESFKINKNSKRISSVKELLTLSTVSYKKGKKDISSEKERYRRLVLKDTLEDMSFFYGQYLRCNNSVEGNKISYIHQKLTSLLHLIEADLTEFKNLLSDPLKTNDKDLLTAAIFALSSIEVENESSASLNKVLASFTECTSEHIPCYINGLTHGKHPKLESSLKLVQAIASKKIKEACKNILKDRKQNHKSDNR